MSLLYDETTRGDYDEYMDFQRRACRLITKTIMPFNKKEEVKHNWDFNFSQLTEDHKGKVGFYTCKECGKVKKEIIDADDHDCKASPSHGCEGCPPKEE